MIAKGTPVKFTAGLLGTIRHLDSSRFTEHVVHEGDSGRYFGPHPNPNLADWHLVEVNDQDGAPCFVPCHDAQFETVS